MEPTRNEKGELVIPATRRPDGTWRKEIVVKEGYVPQDEVKAYQTRFANTKPKGIPGLAPPVEEAPKKKEQKPKPAKAEKPSSSEDPDLSKLKISDPVPIQPAEEKPAVVDIDKKIKGLKKKLRDIEEILKKDQSQLNPEQLEKISKKSQIEEEIRNLEASK